VFCVDLRTAIISLYSINWLVFITETECVYCEIRAGSLHIILRPAHTAVFVCFVWISEQTAIISLHNINWMVFITDGVCLLRGTDWIFVHISSRSQYFKNVLHFIFMLLVWEGRADEECEACNQVMRKYISLLPSLTLSSPLLIYLTFLSFFFVYNRVTPQLFRGVLNPGTPLVLISPHQSCFKERRPIGK
jgi:hypothetical protein